MFTDVVCTIKLVVLYATSTLFFFMNQLKLSHQKTIILFSCDIDGQKPEDCRIKTKMLLFYTT